MQLPELSPQKSPGRLRNTGSHANAIKENLPKRVVIRGEGYHRSLSTRLPRASNIKCGIQLKNLPGEKRADLYGTVEVFNLCLIDTSFVYDGQSKLKRENLPKRIVQGAFGNKFRQAQISAIKTQY